MSHHEIKGKNCYVIPGDKRLKIEAGEPWGFSTHKESRKSGRSWPSKARMWGGTAYTPVCVKKREGRWTQVHAETESETLRVS